MSSIPLLAQSPVSKNAKPHSTSVTVLHVNSGNLYGGVESILATLARSRDLCPEMETHFALCQEGRLSQELSAAGAPVHMLGKVRISRPWTVWKARRKLAEVLHGKRFDVVICHMPWSLAVFGKAVQAAGSKLVFWAHAFHPGRNWLERLARRTKPDLAISNSRFTEAGLDNLYRDVPRGIVYPPVAVAESSGRGQWRAGVREQYKVGTDAVVIIQVSRLEAWKGHRLHLDALSLLRETDGWVCWFVGGAQKPEEQQYEQSLREAAAQLGIGERVRFLGQRQDVARLLEGADIFCQPNLEPEPFGMVFVEALRAGLPVVSVSLGGVLEIVDENCGLLVTPRDPAQLAEALASLIKSPKMRERLGRAGAARGLKLCQPTAQMNILNELCRSVIDKEPGRL